ncbi:hypothetical protein DESPIG_01925 [Desulfovibrio piger ATCC 29098]|uniref:Uncharacterized protein n=1 Tax=Desulfovibrio piger ATCC 29098 TaxID=411464 RepID=B6WV10_9BACT|nr:hypothetical protein DESPIG_01925 [Desulfovibrio piger ATCC 29098]
MRKKDNAPPYPREQGATADGGPVWRLAAPEVSASPEVCPCPSRR